MNDYDLKHIAPADLLFARLPAPSRSPHRPRSVAGGAPVSPDRRAANPDCRGRWSDSPFPERRQAAFDCEGAESESRRRTGRRSSFLNRARPGRAWQLTPRLSNERDRPALAPAHSAIAGRRDEPRVGLEAIAAEPRDHAGTTRRHRCRLLILANRPIMGTRNREAVGTTARLTELRPGGSVASISLLEETFLRVLLRRAALCRRSEDVSASLLRPLVRSTQKVQETRQLNAAHDED